MSKTFDGTGTDGIRDGASGAGDANNDEVSDEVRVDLDEDKLDTWEEVRGDYAVDPDSEVTRPALTEQEEDDDDEDPLREDDEEDDLAEDEDAEDRDEEE
ncbi:hypothetical protein N798_12405 [Knoellia flava TL1]|uniref:Uncharacterized protein n=2 Tax=Knoellia flava TaxID=913969 RepID=A0A8H9FVQ3_9MICO|nr:hypothetical protein [Knoellia flava]KGN29854.1 hypothetical protein N798_12405 [Knoellia flava TL1]GGB84835.1 hypothetical protein GCM10011314_25620 [Knoellia flava]